MEFENTKPIYLQIYDSICEKVVSGEYPPGERIPSVRDFGAEIGVNPNTVMRSYERLTDSGIIFNRRGIGYFVTDDGRNIAKELMRKDFIENVLPGVLKRMKMLGLDPGGLLYDGII